MAAERVLASYIVRVVFRDGQRQVHLHQVGAGVLKVFEAYSDMADFLHRCESDLGPAEVARTSVQGRLVGEAGH